MAKIKFDFKFIAAAPRPPASA